MTLENHADMTQSNNNATCENCNAAIAGPFCSQCGQEAESTLKYFWTVLLHILDDILSFDSRASRTVKPLLANPGFLTNEYIQGRRVHYVPPLKLYLFVSIIFFISLKFISIADEDMLVHKNRQQLTLEQVNTHIKTLETGMESLSTVEQNSRLKDLMRFKQYQTDLSPEVARNIADITKKLADIELTVLEDNEPLTSIEKEEIAHFNEKLIAAKNGENTTVGLAKVSLGNTKDAELSFSFLDDKTNAMIGKKIDELERKAEDAINNDARPLFQQSMSKLPQLMFILLPIFALLLKVMYLFSNRLYLEHLTVALHSHSFIFLTFLIINILGAIENQVPNTLSWLSVSIEYLAMGLMAWVPFYLFIMQKRVYRQGYLLTALKYIFIGLIYINLITFTAVIAFFWGLADI